MRKLYRRLLVLLAICSLLIFVVTGQTWATAYFIEANSPHLVYEFTGRQLQPIIAGVVVVPIVGIVGLIAAKRFLQRIVGFFIFLSGLTIAYFSFQVGQNWIDLLDPLVTNKVGLTGIDYVFETSPANNFLILPALVIAAVGFIFTVRNFDAAKKPAAYDSPNGNVEKLTAWQALDSGIDPTLTDSDSGEQDTLPSSR